MKAAFIIQYFKHPDNIKTIHQRLASYDIAGGAHVLWHNDSRSDQTIFESIVTAPSQVIESDNLHEIRGYNKLATITNAEYLIFMQDDDIPPNSAQWVNNAICAFEKDPKLGVIGYYRGGDTPWDGKRAKYGIATAKSMKTRHPVLGFRFQYMAWLNMGPFIVRREDFFVFGQFDLSYSLPGEPGIGYDHEFATRFWLQGYKAALMHEPSFNRGVGGRGTMTNPVQLILRHCNEVANLKRYQAAYGDYFSHITEQVMTANAALVQRKFSQYKDAYRLRNFPVKIKKELHELKNKLIVKASLALATTKWFVCYKSKNILQRFYAQLTLSKKKKRAMNDCHKVLISSTCYGNAGLFALFTLVLHQLQYCEQLNYLPIIYFGPRLYDKKNPYYEPEYGQNMWEYFFEPVAKYDYKTIQTLLKDPENPINDRDIVILKNKTIHYLHEKNPFGIYAYAYGRYKHKTKYDARWFEKNREKAHKMIKKYIKVKKDILQEVDQFYIAYMQAHHVLGVHMRGSDKGSANCIAHVGRIITPQAYSPLIDAYLKRHPAAKIFVATDQEQYLHFMREKYPERILFADAMRTANDKAIFQLQQGSPYQKGKEALLDCLLLSRCDFLLKCTSHVSETALWFNPALKNIDVNYPDHVKSVFSKLIS